VQGVRSNVFASCTLSDQVVIYRVWAMRDGHLEASGHNWVEGQGAGPRIDKGDAEDDTMYDAMGNKIDNKKAKKLTASEARKVRNRRYLSFALTY
jgi:hypothetical protein